MINDTAFGKVVLVAIGATVVGSINVLGNEGDAVRYGIGQMMAGWALRSSVRLGMILQGIEGHGVYGTARSSRV